MQTQTQIKTSDNLGLDRPDIAKAIAKRELSFKEVKESFFKFLYQVGLPFNLDTKLEIINNYENRDDGNVYKIRAGYYNASCKLEDITVNGKPVYIILLSKNYNNIDLRQKNKLLVLSHTHNLIIFDKEDWSSFNDIEHKQWLKPLTKSILRRWAKVLYHRIHKLGGQVKVQQDLNDLYKNINNNYNKKSSILDLKEENKQLKIQLRVSLFSNLNIETKDTHYSIIESLCGLNHSSSIWIESVIKTIIKSFKHKKTPLDLNLLSDVFEKDIIRQLKSNLKTIHIEKVSENLFKFINTTTLQSFSLFIGKNTKELKINKLALNKLDDLIFCLVFDSSKVNNKILSLMLLKDNYSKITSNYCIYASNRLLYVYNSSHNMEYSLCQPDLKD